MDFNLSDNMQDVYHNRIEFRYSTSVSRSCPGGLVSNDRPLVWFKDLVWILSVLSKHGRHVGKGLNITSPHIRHIFKNAHMIYAIILYVTFFEYVVWLCLGMEFTI